MAWCPKCKNEYREGIKVCADCGCELVDELTAGIVEPVLVGPQEYMYEVKSYLDYNHLEGVEVRYNESKDIYGVFIQDEDKDLAMKLIQVYIRQKNEEAREEAQQSEEETEEVSAEATAFAPEGMDKAEAERVAMERAMAAKEEARKYVNYRNSSDRAADNQSAAWSLLLVGGAVLIFLLLSVFGVLKMNFNPFFYGVMFVVSGIFVIMGIVSLKSAKGYSQVAASEKAQKKEIKQWVEQNVTAQMIDSRLKIHGMSEEEKFFHRNALLKAVINGKFPNLDQAFLEHYIDDTLYDVVYSGEEA